MARKIRVLDAANKTMQRLGFLKPLCAVVNETETSNLESLGKRTIERVTKRVRLMPPFSDDFRDYVKNRLTDARYREFRKMVLNGTNPDAPVFPEIQDLYLADASLPSRTGKLVEANWRRYPYLGTSIELVRKGTYSGLTRSLVLLAVTPKEEIEAFNQYDGAHNPLRLCEAQAIVLLFALIDNDADVIFPLFRSLLESGESCFDERVAGDRLPVIMQQIIRNHRDRPLTVEERDRLTVLSKVALSVEKWKGKPYTGGGARQEAIRVRLEPYCDLGFLTKPDRDRYGYATTVDLSTLLERWQSVADTDSFLQERFFDTFAACRRIPVSPATDAEATQALAQAGESLKSSLGYSPITDVGLLAGARLLTESQRTLELARTTELLKTLQKQDPTFIRFTVDRMGVLAYVKFLKSAPGDVS